MSFFDLPPDILRHEILSRPAQNIFKLCMVNEYIHDICSDDTLWQEKVLIDFPLKYYHKPENITYREYYIKLEIRMIELYYPGEFQTVINIHVHDTATTIKNIEPYLIEYSLAVEIC
jgi:hypothetical protein